MIVLVRRFIFACSTAIRGLIKVFMGVLDDASVQVGALSNAHAGVNTATHQPLLLLFIAVRHYANFQ